MGIEELQSEKAQALLRGAKDLENRKKLFDTLYAYTDANNAAGLRRLYALHGVAVDGDITQLKVLSEEEGAEGQEGLYFHHYEKIKGDVLENCDGCGGRIRHVYKICHTQDASNSMNLGPDCLVELAADLAQFDNDQLKNFLSENEIERRTRRKQRELEKLLEGEDSDDGSEDASMLQDVDAALDEPGRLIALEAKKAELEQENFHLSDELKRKFTLLQRFEKDNQKFYEYDSSGTIKALDLGGSSVGWFRREEKEGKLPGNIGRIFGKFENKYMDVTLAELQALRIYQATFRPHDRHAEIGIDEDDLRLFQHVSRLQESGLSKQDYLKLAREKLKKDNDALSKQGKEQESKLEYLKKEETLLNYLHLIDPSFAETIFDEAEETEIPSDVDRLFLHGYVTKMDALKVWMAKDDLKEIRARVNSAYLFTFQNGPEGEDIEKVIDAAMPFFDKDKCLWHKELSTGEFVYEKTMNPRDYKAVKDFLFLSSIGGGEVLDNFVRRLSVVQFKDMAERLISIGRKMNYMDAKKDKSVLKGDKYRPVETFSQHSRVGKPLDEMMDKLRNTDLPEKGTHHLRNFITKYLPSIEEQRQFGLFDKNLVDRIDYYFWQLSSYKAVEEDEEFSVTHKLLNLVKGMPLVSCVGQIPDFGKKFYDKAAKKVLQGAEKSAQAIQEIWEKYDPEQAAAGFKKLQDYAEKYVGIEGRLGSSFSLNTATFSLSHVKERKGCFETYHPEKIEKRLRFIGENFTPLQEIEDEDDQFMHKLETIADLEDMISFILEDTFYTNPVQLSGFHKQFLDEKKKGMKVLVSNDARAAIDEMFDRIMKPGGYKDMRAQYDKIMGPAGMHTVEHAMAEDRKLRLFAVNAAEEDEKFLQELGLCEFHQEKRQQFAYAFTPRDWAKKLPLLSTAKKLAEYNLQKKRNISLKIEIDDEVKDRYDQIEKVIFEKGRELYHHLPGEGRIVDATLVKAIDGTSEEDRRRFRWDELDQYSTFRREGSTGRRLKQGIKRWELDHVARALQRYNLQHGTRYEIELKERELTVLEDIFRGSRDKEKYDAAPADSRITVILEQISPETKKRQFPGEHIHFFKQEGLRFDGAKKDWYRTFGKHDVALLSERIEEYNTSAEGYNIRMRVKDVE